MTAKKIPTIVDPAMLTPTKQISSAAVINAQVNSPPANETDDNSNLETPESQIVSLRVRNGENPPLNLDFHKQPRCLSLLFGAASTHPSTGKNNQSAGKS